MEIVLASKNRHKIAELERLLGEYIEGVRILSLDDIGFDGDIVEDGSSFSENALIKARAVAALGYIGVGDDSGLEVKALGGAPGIFSARYAGEHGNDEANNVLLLENLKGTSDRSACFACAVGCAFPNGDEFFVEARTDGVIIEDYRGDGGFGYDPLFLYEPMGKTFAQMSADEKNSISHRGKAIRLFAERIAKRKLTEV